MNSASENSDGSRPNGSSGMPGDPHSSYSSTGSGAYPESDSEIRNPFADPNDSESNFGGYLANWLCVILILLLVGFIFFSQRQTGGEAVKHSPRADLAEFTFQAKVLLGFQVVADKNPMFEDQLDDQQKPQYGKFGSVRVRQAGAVMVSELQSPEDALVVLTLLERKADELGYEFSPEEKKTTSLLQTLFQDSAAALTPLEKEHLKRELLWFGQLALHPAPGNDQKVSDPIREELLQGAESTLLTFGGLALLILCCFIVGLIGAIVMLVFYCSDKLIIRTIPRTAETSIYLECFTIWLLTFVLLSLILGVAFPGINQLVGNGIVFLTSLAASFLWSVWRGKYGKQFRSDIGYCGNPVKELPIAIWCYLCTMPLVAIGFLITSILLAQSASGATESLESSGPAHPLLEWVMKGDSWTIGMVFFIACFCAPVVEETVFRGFLYRALRDGSYRLGQFKSSLFAATINGLLFAAIHPQGVFFIPALCALGMGFSFARELRGSLWTPMFMHALHNGILTVTLVFIVMA